MHIGEILRADCANGPGMRVTVFVSGCTNHCKGCFQPDTISLREDYFKDMDCPVDIKVRMIYDGEGGGSFIIKYDQGSLSE